MPKVAIITDSTAGIPVDLLNKHHITVVPQVLIWGEETFEDGVDIHPTEFYQRLENAKTMPTTSQVTIGSFQKVYRHFLDAGQEILSIHLAHSLSGTIDSAVQARDMFPGEPIELVDSGTVSMALGFPVLMAARAAQSGASLAECKQIAEESCRNTGVVFAVSTLEFLHRGGRIGGASRFLGTALNIKPILEITGGKVEAIERVRTRKKSLQRIIELIAERIDGRHPIRLSVLHAKAPEEAREILAQATERLAPVESIFSEVSPVIGTHAGPGTVGLAYLAGFD